MMKNKKNILLGLVFFLLSITTSLHAQPANDNCANATSLIVNTLPICGQTTANATTQAGETKPCGVTGGQTVWYKFIATQPIMDVWIDNLVSGGCHIASGVWSTGTCFPAATLSCKGAVGPTDIWHHLTGLVVGNTYLISVVYGNGGACGASQTFCISVVAPPQTTGYTAPTVGQGGTYVGACMVNTCSGQFYDNGGANSNYSNNINQIYRVFCPNVAGNCVRATVNYADMEQGFDYLQIRNGDTQNSPLLVQMSMYGNSIWTSTDPSGCLTFRFNSDASVVRAGFNITLSCVPCANGPTGTANNDCINATPVCTNTNITGSSTGPGLISESCNGCTVGGENNSNWYSITIATSGTLYLTLDPTVNTDDYDFALYGPNVTCNTLGSPIRCSYAATTTPGNTGLGNGALDFSEDVLGNSWVAPLNVVAGQTYYLMVNKWDPTPGSGFTLYWTGGAGGSSTASLDCNPLPVELMEFKCEGRDNDIVLQWTTSSEINNDYFIVEHSFDGINYNELTKVKGNNNSNQITEYIIADNQPVIGTNYYKLSQVDFDGTKREYSPTVCEYGINLNTIKRIDLFDVNGKFILSKLENTKDLKSVIDNLPIQSGIYFLYITYDNNITNVKKFVKI